MVPGPGTPSADCARRTEVAVTALTGGGCVVLVDDELVDGEADLVMAAQFATPRAIAFFVQHTSGLLCAPLTAGRADELGLRAMVGGGVAEGPPFTVSVDAADGVTTGTSAIDRARTLRVLADPQARAQELRRPGHVTPVLAEPPPAISRVRPAGGAAATVGLLRLARLTPVGVSAGLVTEDGVDLCRIPEAGEFAKRFELPTVSIADVLRCAGDPP